MQTADDTPPRKPHLGTTGRRLMYGGLALVACSLAGMLLWAWFIDGSEVASVLMNLLSLTFLGGAVVSVLGMIVGVAARLLGRPRN